MNYHTDIVIFFGGGVWLIGKGRLLERGAYFQNLTFWRGALYRGALISEWALIRSFTVFAKYSLCILELKVASFYGFYEIR